MNKTISHQQITKTATETTHQMCTLNPFPASSATSAHPVPLHFASFTQLAFLINFIIGNRPADLSLSEVRAAADDGRLVCLLATRYHHIADFYYLIYKPARLEQLEAALTDAGKILKWGESHRIGVSRSGLCLALAIVLEAIQQQFVRMWRPAAGESSPTFPPAVAN